MSLYLLAGLPAGTYLIVFPTLVALQTYPLYSAATQQFRGNPCANQEVLNRDLPPNQAIEYVLSIRSRSSCSPATGQAGPAQGKPGEVMNLCARIA